MYLWATTPVLISVATFSAYVLSGNELTAARVFTAVALFAMLTGPVNAFPWVLNGLVEALVSVRRIAAFLSLPAFRREGYFDRPEELVDLEEAEATEIALRGATLDVASSPPTRTTDVDEREEGGRLNFRLQDLELTVGTGELVGVVGKVGSGKSLLLQALLGELRKSDGSVGVRDRLDGVGYAQQEPWLQQGTVRENILFGSDFSPDWYGRVVDACALREDLDSRLPGGDAAQVGENGALLSGGQRARVALARAVYQDKEVYLIDDVFAAVDAPVGEHIYRKCISGLLREKTR